MKQVKQEIPPPPSGSMEALSKNVRKVTDKFGRGWLKTIICFILLVFAFISVIWFVLREVI